MITFIIYILEGLNMTLLIFTLTTILSIPLGLLMAIGSFSKNTILKKIIEIYVWIFRGTPLMLQLFFVYYGLPSLGVILDPITSALVTFVINYAAYFSEIFRGSIQAIDSGQYEASKVLGMNYYQTMYRIIIPQALRTAVPPMGNELLSLIKNTSLISTIGLAEILRNSKEIVAREFTIVPFAICGIIYLTLSTVLEYNLKKIEKKLVM